MQKKNVLITGANSGFGRLTAEHIAQAGHTAIACMRHTNSKNQAAANELSAKENILVMDLDVTDQGSIDKLFATLRSSNTKLDVLVNNAGVAGIGLSETFTLEDVKKTFDVNFFGLFAVSQQAIAMMREQKDGLIISVTSVMGRIVIPIWAMYSASKYAVEALAETWKYELMPVGIDSVIVEPGAYPTTGIAAKMHQYSPENGNPEIKQAYGPLAHMQEIFAQQMQELVESGQAPDPMDVASEILKLIETPKGQRPTRVVVDKMFAEMLAPYNLLSDQISQGMMQNMQS